MSLILSLLIPFLITGFMYAGIEVGFDNTSHRSMIVAGGVSYTICSFYIRLVPSHYWVTCFVCAVIIMIVEYGFGRVFNKDFTIWDYRNVVWRPKRLTFRGKKIEIPLHIHGQVCIPFFLIWFLGISHVIIYIYHIFAQINW